MGSFLGIAFECLGELRLFGMESYESVDALPEVVAFAPGGGGSLADVGEVGFGAWEVASDAIEVGAVTVVGVFLGDDAALCLCEIRSDVGEGIVELSCVLIEGAE